jgi:nicotinamidase/pyrazinamidase
LQKRFERVIATKDWHPPGHGSFASGHPGREVGERTLLAGLEQVLWPDHCVEDTPGSEFAPGLETSKVEKVFFKGTDPTVDSYSAFFDNAHRRSTGLGDYLRGKGVDEVYILGLATDYCVKFSVLDALELGFKVHVVADGCRAVNLRQGDGESSLEEMRRAGAEVITSAEVAPAPVTA